MVYDQIYNLKKYKTLLPNLEKLEEYLLHHNPRELPLGEIRVDEDLILKVKEYVPRSKAEARWEAHRVFADVQYVVRGHELMGVAPLKEMIPNDAYNSVSDSIHADHDRPGEFFPLKEGAFMLLMPEDVHMPSLRDDTEAEETVFKIIAKVRI